VWFEAGFEVRWEINSAVASSPPLSCTNYWSLAFLSPVSSTTILLIEVNDILAKSRLEPPMIPQKLKKTSLVRLQRYCSATFCEASSCSLRDEIRMYPPGQIPWWAANKNQELNCSPLLKERRV
jgi:hypothetical protein